MLKSPECFVRSRSANSKSESAWQNEQLKYVGHSVARVDGFDKVTGAAKFVGDITVPGMLYGKILRSTYPHARLRSIDTSQAEALAGVVAVLTAADLGDLNLIYNGRPVIATDKVRYVGEPVAAVAAVDLETAEEALGLIEVDYEELPAVTGIDAAIANDAPLVHDDKSGNIGTHEKVLRGDIDQGFADSDEIAEDTFHLSHGLSLCDGAPFGDRAL